MEDTLREDTKYVYDRCLVVLILVLMEDTLRVVFPSDDSVFGIGLNPCSNGRYSQRAKPKNP